MVTSGSGLTFLSARLIRMGVSISSHYTQVHAEQTPGIAPFYLYANLVRPWMCPVHAFAQWWKVMSKLSNGPPQGFVFRKKMGRDGFSLNPLDGMVWIISHYLFQNMHPLTRTSSHQNLFLSAFETTFWTWVLTPGCMAHIH